MPPVLFAASAKGIQEYIFRSDKLREMVGASGLVDDIPNSLFDRALKACGIASVTAVTRAAGNIRVLIDDEAKAKELLRIWPVLVASHAPGLESVQTVVPVGASLKDAFDQAEAELAARRNRPTPSLPVAGPMVIRSRRTGQPAVVRDKEDYLSAESLAKRDRAKEDLPQLRKPVAPESEPWARRESAWAYDFGDIAVGESPYIALVHADANGLGGFLSSLLREGGEPKVLAERLAKVSQAVEECLLAAVRAALKDLFDRHRKEEFLPVRFIVCAGDDLTVVLPAKDAPEFVDDFLKKFEQESAARLAPLGRTEGLTASAGIVFLKTKYPFYRAYELCESLCGAVKAATDRKSSGVAFHRITKGAASDFGQVREELTTPEGLLLTLNPWSAGGKPSDLPKFEDLINLVEAADKLPRGALRRIFAAAYEGRQEAERLFRRFEEVAKESRGEKWQTFASLLRKITGTDGLWLAKDGRTLSPLADIVELSSIMTTTEET